MDDDVMMLGITPACLPHSPKQINLPTQNADPKNISYHGLHTLPDSCPAANTAKPAGLSRKGQ